MSKFADAYVKKLQELRNAENTFYFDGDSIVLVPKDLENMNKLKEFEAARVQGIQSNLREKLALEIESAVIEVAGNSAATMEQAARIVRGNK